MPRHSILFGSEDSLEKLAMRLCSHQRGAALMKLSADGVFEHAANRALYEIIVDTLVDQFGRCWFCCLLEGLQGRTRIWKQSRFSKGQVHLYDQLRRLPQQ